MHARRSLLLLLWLRVTSTGRTSSPRKASRSRGDTGDLSTEAYAATNAGRMCLPPGRTRRGRAPDRGERARGASAREHPQRRELDRALGGIALARGDYPQARALFEESLGIHRTLDDPWGISHSLSRLALVSLEAHDNDAARRLVAESLAIEREVGDRLGQLFNFEVLAELAAADGRPARAARLYACASVLREADGQSTGGARLARPRARHDAASVPCSARKHSPRRGRRDGR